MAAGLVDRGRAAPDRGFRRDCLHSGFVRDEHVLDPPAAMFLKAALYLGGMYGVARLRKRLQEWQPRWLRSESSRGPATKGKAPAATLDCEECEASNKEVQAALWVPNGSIMSIGLEPPLKIMYAGRGLLSMEKPFEMAYFPIRAVAELPQLLLEFAGHPYVFHVHGGPRWVSQVKATTPFGRMPMLLGFDGGFGGMLPQSDAMVRYLGGKLGLAGGNAEEQAYVDAWFCQLQEMTKDSVFSVDALREGPTTPNEVVPRWADTSAPSIARGEVSTYALSLGALRVLEDAVRTSSTGWVVPLASGGASYVDLAVWRLLNKLEEIENVPDWAERFDLPALAEIFLKLDVALADFVGSTRMLPRTAPGYLFKPSRGSPPPGYEYTPPPPPEEEAGSSSA